MKDLGSEVKRIRFEFEHRNIQKSLLVLLYSKYQKVEDVEGFIDQAVDLFPRLNCGVASLYLWHTFGRGKVICGRYKSQRHTVWQIDKQCIVDITADQFGGPAVYIGPLQPPWGIH